MSSKNESGDDNQLNEFRFAEMNKKIDSLTSLVEKVVSNTPHHGSSPGLELPIQGVDMSMAFEEEVFELDEEDLDSRRFSTNFRVGTILEPPKDDFEEFMTPHSKVSSSKGKGSKLVRVREVKELGDTVKFLKNIGVVEFGVETDDPLAWKLHFDAKVEGIYMSEEIKCLVVQAFLPKHLMHNLTARGCTWTDYRKLFELLMEELFGGSLAGMLPKLLFNIDQKDGETIIELVQRIEETMVHILFFFKDKPCVLDLAERDLIMSTALEYALKPSWFDKFCAIRSECKSKGEEPNFLVYKRGLLQRADDARLRDSRRVGNIQSVNDYADHLNRDRKGSQGGGKRNFVGVVDGEHEGGNDGGGGEIGTVKVSMILGTWEGMVGIDSCSSFNIVSHRFAKAQGWMKDVDCSQSKKLLGIGGTCRVCGTLRLPVALSDNGSVGGDLEFSVIDAELPYPLIGTSGQISLDLVPDAVRGQILIKSLQEAVSATVIDDSYVAAKLKGDFVIPPCGGLVVNIDMDGLEDGSYLISPITGNDQVVFEEGTTNGSIRILNPHPRPLNLIHGTIIGKLTLPHAFQVIAVHGGEVMCPENMKHLGVEEYASASYEDWVGTRPTPDIDQIELGEELSKEQAKEVRRLLRSFQNIFASGAEMADAPFEMEIDTGENPPVNVPLRRMSQKKSDLIQAEVEKLLLAGLIEPSNSPWAAPVCLVRKKDGSYRFCVDYRRLNAITIPDQFPIPAMDSLLAKLEGCKYFTCLDLSQGFWQFKLSPESALKTAFRTSSGLYHFKVLSMGLRNSPPAFQRAMTIVLAGLPVIIYLDDVLVLSQSWEEHVHILGLVLQRFKDYKLVLNPKKCQFAMTKFKYLGVCISGEGITPDPERVEALRNRPSPTNDDELSSWLGKLGWCSKFIPSFSDKAKVLRTLLNRKEGEWDWEDVHEGALREMVEDLCQDTLLRHPDYDQPFYIMCDASAYAVGSVLLQEVDGELAPLYFHSRTLKSAERNYPAIERELLAIMVALKSFEFMIWGCHTIILSDHNPLKYLQLKEVPSERLMRWALILQEVHLEIRYVKGG